MDQFCFGGVCVCVFVWLVAENCLVHPVNDRAFSLLNSVKYDCSLISFSASWQVDSFEISANYLIYAVTVFNFFELFTYAVTVSIFSEIFSYAATVFFRNYFCISFLWKGTSEPSRFIGRALKDQGQTRGRNKLNPESVRETPSKKKTANR